MGDKISFSAEVLQFDDVAVSHSDIERSIRFYYAAPSMEIRDTKFIGYTPQEIQEEQNLRLGELDKSSVFHLLAALEASFRTDFLLRCYQRQKDEISRCFRALHKRKGNKVSFEEDIIENWKTHFPPAKHLLSELKGALRYRHWLAHGRYWTPKLGQKYDFLSVYMLAQELEQSLHLLSSG
jgi:hypothetical protein